MRQTCFESAWLEEFLLRPRRVFIFGMKEIRDRCMSERDGISADDLQEALIRKKETTFVIELRDSITRILNEHTIVAKDRTSAAATAAGIRSRFGVRRR